jgi:hypothetical protein
MSALTDREKWSNGSPRNSIPGGDIRLRRMLASAG